MKEAIKIAVNNGELRKSVADLYWVDGNWEAVVMKVEFWKALEKALGWDFNTTGDWKDKWHDFINHMIEENRPDDFFKELLK